MSLTHFYALCLVCMLTIHFCSVYFLADVSTVDYFVFLQILYNFDIYVCMFKFVIFVCHWVLIFCILTSTHFMSWTLNFDFNFDLDRLVVSQSQFVWPVCMYVCLFVLLVFSSFCSSLLEPPRVY